MTMAETLTEPLCLQAESLPAEIENVGNAGIDGMRGRQRAVTGGQRHRNDGGFGRLLEVVGHLIFSIEIASPP
jgi:hypothetical protein